MFRAEAYKVSETTEAKGRNVVKFGSGEAKENTDGRFNAQTKFDHHRE